MSPKVKVMLRRGQAGFKFGEAEELFTPDFNTYYLYNDLKSIGAEIYQSTKINVEDIDNDGIQEDGSLIRIILNLLRPLFIK